MKCLYTDCGRTVSKSVALSQANGDFKTMCGKHFNAYIKRRTVVRVSYKIKRIANNAWGLCVTMTNRDIASGTGGGEFRLIAAFDSNDELADWIKAHPAPKPYVAGLQAAEMKAQELTGYYHIELAERIFWGTPSPRATGCIERFKELKLKKNN